MSHGGSSAPRAVRACRKGEAAADGVGREVEGEAQRGCHVGGIDGEEGNWVQLSDGWPWSEIKETYFGHLSADFEQNNRVFFLVVNQPHRQHEPFF